MTSEWTNTRAVKIFMKIQLPMFKTLIGTSVLMYQTINYLSIKKQGNLLNCYSGRLRMFKVFNLSASYILNIKRLTNQFNRFFTTLSCNMSQKQMSHKTIFSYSNVIDFKKHHSRFNRFLKTYQFQNNKFCFTFAQHQKTKSSL